MSIINNISDKLVSISKKTKNKIVKSFLIASLSISIFANKRKCRKFKRIDSNVKFNKDDMLFKYLSAVAEAKAVRNFIIDEMFRVFTFDLSYFNWQCQGNHKYYEDAVIELGEVLNNKGFICKSFYGDCIIIANNMHGFDKYDKKVVYDYIRNIKWLFDCEIKDGEAININIHRRS